MTTSASVPNQAAPARSAELRWPKALPTPAGLSSKGFAQVFHTVCGGAGLGLCHSSGAPDDANRRLCLSEEPWAGPARKRRPKTTFDNGGADREREQQVEAESQRAQEPAAEPPGPDTAEGSAPGELAIGDAWISPLFQAISTTPGVARAPAEMAPPDDGPAESSTPTARQLLPSAQHGELAPTAHERPSAATPLPIAGAPAAAARTVAADCEASQRGLGTGESSPPVRSTDWPAIPPAEGADESLQGGATSNGTASALTDAAMQKMGESRQECRVNEQNLPGKAAALASAAENVLNRAGELLQRDSRPLPGLEALQTAAASVVGPGSVQLLPEAVVAGPMIGLPAAPAAPNSALQELILNQAAQVRSLGADTLGVLLKPDPKTEVFLLLRQRNGQVEAQARCERGDARRLEGEWDTLRAALAQHGVRLAPLAEPASAKEAAPRPPQSQQTPTDPQSNSRRHSPRRTHDFLDELPMVGSLTEPLKRRAARSFGTARHGWESWA